MAIGTLAYKIVMNNSNFLAGSVATKKELAQGRQMMLANRSPLQVYQAQVAKAGDLLKKGAIDQRTFNAELARAKTGYTNASGGLGAWINKIKGVAGPVAIAAAAVLVAKKAWEEFKRVIAEVNNQFNVIDKLAKTGATLGITTAQVQAFGLAGELAGRDTQLLETAILKLQESAVNAKDGMQEQSRAFERLGINAAEFLKLNPVDQYRQAATALSGLKNQSELAATAADLFGRSGKQLIPLFREGGGAIDTATAFLKKYNVAISNADSAKIEAANDAWTRLKTVFSGFFQRIAITAAPLLQTIAEKLLSLFSHTDILQAFFNQLKAGIDFAIFGFTEIFKHVDALLRGFNNAAKAWNAFTDLIGLTTPAPVADLTKEVDKFNQSAMASSDIFKRQSEGLKAVSAERQALADRGAAVTQSFRTDAERIRGEVGELNKLVSSGYISWETYERGVAKARKELQQTGRVNVDAPKISFESVEQGSAKAFDILFRSQMDKSKAVDESIAKETKRTADGIEQLILKANEPTPKNAGGGVTNIMVDV